MKKLKSCNIKVCKAACCGFAPFPKDYLSLYKDKIKRISAIEIPCPNNHIVVVDKNQCCIFLDEKYRCSIYENRPEICRLFGDKNKKDEPLLVCSYKR